MATKQGAHVLSACKIGPTVSYWFSVMHGVGMGNRRLGISFLDVVRHLHGQHCSSCCCLHKTLKIRVWPPTDPCFGAVAQVSAASQSGARGLSVKCPVCRQRHPPCRSRGFSDRCIVHIWKTSAMNRTSCILPNVHPGGSKCHGYRVSFAQNFHWGANGNGLYCHDCM
jgi:hypothetical protein